MNNFKQSLQSLIQQGLDCKAITHQELVFAACQVARSVLHLVPAGENKPRLAIGGCREVVCLSKRKECEDAADVADAVAAAADAAADAANADDDDAYAADAAAYAVLLLLMLLLMLLIMLC